MVLELIDLLTARLIALANKMAGGIWAMLKRNEYHRDPVTVGT